MSCGWGLAEGICEGPVELAGDVTLEAAADFAGAQSLGGPARDVGAGAGAVPNAGHGDGVDRAVEGSVATAVEPVAGGLAAGGLDGTPGVT